jgi:hypothetical protein
MEPVQSSYTTLNCWERLWAPYDDATYQAVLSAITPQDTLLDIGAGDLRLAIRAAAIAQQVYAIEIQLAILAKARTANLPGNLVVIPGDARNVPFPPGITAAILLMRHCTHFHLYMKKLIAAGCHKLITNARWRSGLEVIELNVPRMAYEELELGWYACLCGSTGFKTGAAEKITQAIADEIFEVSNCPGCHIPVGNTLLQKVNHQDFESLPGKLDESEEPITLFLEGARAK